MRLWNGNCRTGSGCIHSGHLIASLSSGAVAVQIMTCLFPDPGPAMMEMEDARYPSGTVLVPVIEVERRKDHIDLINPTHPLLSVARSVVRFLLPGFVCMIGPLPWQPDH